MSISTQKRCHAAIKGVSSVLQDVTEELNHLHNQVQHWKIEAEAWKCRFEQERCRNERLRRVLRCNPARDCITAQPSLLSSPRAAGSSNPGTPRCSQQHEPPSTAHGGSCSTNRTLSGRGAVSFTGPSSCFLQEKQCAVSNVASNNRAEQQHEQQQQQQHTYGQIAPAGELDSAFCNSSILAPADDHCLEPLKCVVQQVCHPYDSAAKGQRHKQGVDTATAAAAATAATTTATAAATVVLHSQDPQQAAATDATPPDSQQQHPESKVAPNSSNRDEQQAHSSSSSSTSGFVHDSAVTGSSLQASLSHPTPPTQTFRRSRTLPYSYSGSQRSTHDSGLVTLSSGWAAAAADNASVGGQSRRHTVDQLLRMMMAFTLMQSGSPGAPDADGSIDMDSTEDDPLPSVSLDDDDGSSGVGLAAAAAVSAAMARAWASAASKEQRAVAAAAAAANGSCSGNGSGHGEKGGEGGNSSGSGRAGFRLVATVTNKMGKRASSNAALSSAASQESIDSISSNNDLAGLVRGNSVGSSGTLQLPAAYSSGGGTATHNSTTNGSGNGSSNSGIPRSPPSRLQQSAQPAADNSNRNNSSGSSKDSSNSSKKDSSKEHAVAADKVAGSSAGAAPNTGQASAISLHWLSRPRNVLVMRKLAPSTEAIFLKCLEWLRRHKITVYVEPKVFENLVNDGKVVPATREAHGDSSGGGGTGSNCSGNGSSSNNTQCLTGMLLQNALAIEGSKDGKEDRSSSNSKALATSISWPAVSSNRYQTSKFAAMSSGAAGVIKTWQPSVQQQQWQGQQHEQQQQGQEGTGGSSHTSVSDLIPEAVAQLLDLVVVLGGDGTVLWTCHIFGNRSVPPLVPFNLGSLGFLTPFDPARLEQVLCKTLKGGFPITLRHRLHCTIVRGANSPTGEACPRQIQPSSNMPALSHSCIGSVVYGEEHVALNEVVLERGSSPFLTNLECFCDGAFVTHVQGDGLIMGTPTGSTAYSLAAGGSMVHPQVPCILFTPICPHSLSFRPLMFPDYCQLCIQVPLNSRGSVWASFDGKDRTELGPGDAAVVQLSRWPVPSVAAEADPSGDWFSAVRECLHWNVRKVQGGAGA